MKEQAPKQEVPSGSYVEVHPDSFLGKLLKISKKPVVLTAAAALALFSTACVDSNYLTAKPPHTPVVTETLSPQEIQYQQAADKTLDVYTSLIKKDKKLTKGQATTLTLAALFEPNEDADAVLTIYKDLSAKKDVKGDIGALLTVTSVANNYDANSIYSLYEQASEQTSLPKNSGVAAQMTNLAVLNGGDFYEALAQDQVVLSGNSKLNDVTAMSIAAANLISKDKDLSETLQTYDKLNNIFSDTKLATQLTTAAVLSNGDIQKVYGIYELALKDVPQNQAPDLTLATVINGYDLDGVKNMYGYIKKFGNITSEQAASLTLATFLKLHNELVYPGTPDSNPGNITSEEAATQQTAFNPFFIYFCIYMSSNAAFSPYNSSYEDNSISSEDNAVFEDDNGENVDNGGGDDGGSYNNGGSDDGGSDGGDSGGDDGGGGFDGGGGD